MPETGADLLFRVLFSPGRYRSFFDVMRDLCGICDGLIGAAWLALALVAAARAYRFTEE